MELPVRDPVTCQAKPQNRLVYYSTCIWMKHLTARILCVPIASTQCTGSTISFMSYLIGLNLFFGRISLLWQTKCAAQYCLYQIFSGQRKNLGVCWCRSILLRLRKCSKLFIIDVSIMEALYYCVYQSVSQLWKPVACLIFKQVHRSLLGKCRIGWLELHRIHEYVSYTQLVFLWMAHLFR